MLGIGEFSVIGPTGAPVIMASATVGAGAGSDPLGANEFRIIEVRSPELGANHALLGSGGGVDPTFQYVGVPYGAYNAGMFCHAIELLTSGEFQKSGNARRC